jgi:H+/Cl- antiporter ClcA
MISFLLGLILTPLAIASLSLGFGALIFKSLNQANLLRDHHFPWVLLFPIFHVFLHFTSRNAGSSIPRNLKEIFTPHEFHQGRASPVLQTFLVQISTFLKTFLSHLFGGSVGREAVVVHLSAISSSLFARTPFLNTFSFLTVRKALLAVAFSVAVGNPYAAFTILFEKDVRGLLSLGLIWNVGIGIGLVNRLEPIFGNVGILVPALTFPKAGIPAIDAWSWKLFGALGLFSLFACALMKIFVSSVRSRIFTTRRLWVTLPIAVFYGLFVFFYPATPWVGLGIASIEGAFSTPSSFLDPFLKMILTIFSVGLGFFGGEYIPLLFVGSTFGSAYGHAFGFSGALFPGIGLFLFYGIATRLPLTALTLMVGTFGDAMLPYALFCGLIGFLFQPKDGLFTSK